MSTNRGVVIKYKELSLEAFCISIKEEHVSIFKKHWPFYCNCPPHISVNRDFQPSPQLSVRREDLFNALMRKLEFVSQTYDQTLLKLQGLIKLMFLINIGMME